VKKTVRKKIVGRGRAAQPKKEGGGQKPLKKNRGENSKEKKKNIFGTSRAGPARAIKKRRS